MKQTEKVSIGGYAFNLDSDAAAVADAYLKDVEAFYNNSEITDGIEERMAELLLEKVPGGNVVTKANVEEVIGILGRPERIAEDDPQPAEQQAKPARKLYRDMENARIAGVCGGIGAYFNFDPIILRLIFAVLTFAGLFAIENHAGITITVPIIYLILWIAIPPARTAQQRWALRGDDGSAESVRRSVEKNSGELGDAIRQVGNAPVWGGIWRVLEVVFGIILVITAVSGLFAGALALFGWQWLGLSDIVNEGVQAIGEEYPSFMGVVSTLWVKILGITVYFLPFIGMLYGGIMMLFRIKAPSWHPGLVLFLVWLIAVAALVILIFACAISADAIAEGTSTMQASALF